MLFLTSNANHQILFNFQGKYMEVSFDFKGDPIGGLISNCK